MGDPPDDDPFFAAVGKMLNASEDEIRAWQSEYASQRPSNDERDSDGYELRSFLFAFLKRQHSKDAEYFWNLVDGLTIGRLPPAELRELVSRALEKLETDRAKAPPRRGRPAEAVRLLPHVDPLLSDAIRREYRELCEVFRDFSATRRHYHATVRRKRSAARRMRDQVRSSPLGLRLLAACCFRVYFDTKRLTPTQMAANLIHRETKRWYRTSEKACRAAAATTLSSSGRERALRGAAQALEHRHQLRSWQTLHDRLKRSPRSKHPPRAQDR